MSKERNIRKCYEALQKNPKNKNAEAYLSAFTREEKIAALEATEPEPEPVGSGASLQERLEDLRRDWEHGYTQVAVYRPNNWTVIVVAKFNHDLYSVFRYFTIADKWQVSCDANRVHTDEAFKTLARVIS